MNIHEFITMNGYGPYVWGSYGFAAVVLGWLVISTIIRARAAKRGNRK